jgi:hypothetical protein
MARTGAWQERVATAAGQGSAVTDCQAVNCCCASVWRLTLAPHGGIAGGRARERLLGDVQRATLGLDEGDTEREVLPRTRMTMMDSGHDPGRDGRGLQWHTSRGAVTTQAGDGRRNLGTRLVSPWSRTPLWR